MSGVIDVDGVPIAYRVHGPERAPAVVFSHSLGSDHSAWEPQVEALADEHRLVSIDTRGHGGSGSPPGPYRLDDLGRDLMGVVDSLGIDRFHVCGLSLGGQVALWAAINRPDRLLSATACNTAAKIGSDETWGARISAVEAGGMASIGEAIVDRWFSPGFAAANPQWYARARRVFDATDPAGYTACCAALASADLRDQVASITVPMLLVAGDLDASTPPADLEWLHHRIAGSEIEVLAGVAHLSNLDDPPGFNARLGAFLADH